MDLSSDKKAARVATSLGYLAARTPWSREPKSSLRDSHRFRESLFLGFLLAVAGTVIAAYFLR